MGERPLAANSWFPWRRKTPAAKSRVVTTFVGSITVATMAIAVPFIYDKEGEKLEAYRDVAGVWTICSGETVGVVPGQKVSKAYCTELTKSRVWEFMSKVDALVQPELTPETLAAHTSFAYNIGMAGYARSTALRETNAGNIAGGCHAMSKWYTAGGKDCRIKGNGCYGLINRRNDEIKLCLQGVM